MNFLGNLKFAGFEHQYFETGYFIDLRIDFRFCVGDVAGFYKWELEPYRP